MGIFNFKKTKKQEPAKVERKPVPSFNEPKQEERAEAIAYEEKKEIVASKLGEQASASVQITEEIEPSTSEQLKIWSLFLEGGSINSIEAPKMGIYRLSAIIYDLRKKHGQNVIKTTMLQVGKKRIASYSLNTETFYAERKM